MYVLDTLVTIFLRTSVLGSNTKLFLFLRVHEYYYEFLVVRKFSLFNITYTYFIDRNKYYIKSHVMENDIVELNGDNYRRIQKSSQQTEN